MGDLATVADTGLKFLEIAAAFGSAAVVLIRVGRMAERFELLISQQAVEITELKEGQDKLATLMTEVALQKQRLDMMDQRYEDLRRGQGYITAR